MQYIKGATNTVITVGDGIYSFGDITAVKRSGEVAPRLEDVLPIIDSKLTTLGNSSSAGGATIVFGRGNWISRTPYTWTRNGCKFIGSGATNIQAASSLPAGIDTVGFKFSGAFNTYVAGFNFNCTLLTTAAPSTDVTFGVRAANCGGIVIENNSFDHRLFLITNPAAVDGTAALNSDPAAPHMGYTDLGAIKIIGTPQNTATIRGNQFIGPNVYGYGTPPTTVTHGFTTTGRYTPIDVYGVGGLLITDNIFGQSHYTSAFTFISQADALQYQKIKYGIKMEDCAFKVINDNIFNPSIIERSLIYDGATYPHYDFGAFKLSEAGHFACDGNVGHTLFYNDAIIHTRSGGFYTLGDTNQFGQLFGLTSSSRVIKVQAAADGVTNVGKPYRPTTVTIRGDWHWSTFSSGSTLCPTVDVEDVVQSLVIGPLELENTYSSDGNGHSPIEIRNCKMVHIKSVSCSTLLYGEWDAAPSPNVFRFYPNSSESAGCKLIKITDDAQQQCHVFIDGCMAYYGFTGIVNAVENGSPSWNYSESVDSVNNIVSVTCSRIKMGHCVYVDATSSPVSPGTSWLVKQANT